MARLTDLNYLLLGLVARQSQTAYSLAQSLGTTPMSVYSDSPGSVYPAVRKLVRLGLIEESPAPPQTRGRRPRILAITRAGRAELERWLEQPLTGAELTQRPGTVILRLSLLSAVLGEERLPEALRQLRREAETSRRELQVFTEEHRQELPLGSRLPMELAQEILATYARWARRSLRDLE